MKKNMHKLKTELKEVKRSSFSDYGVKKMF
jgi:hypothetical protein